MKKIGLLILPFLFGFILYSSAKAAEFRYDLGLQALRYSATQFIAGKTVRIYASVYNYGTEDTKAHVIFRLGSQLIGTSQEISVLAGGMPDEVYIDFEVPNTEFNIQAKIQEEIPRDENSSNDSILTSVFTPLFDSDNDGVTDDKDNCPKVSNSDQSNYDRDSEGDACDADDDNDGLTDVEESRLGTNPRNADSDGDGVSDLDDFYPLDASRSKKALPLPPEPPKEPEVVNETTVEPAPSVTSETSSQDTGIEVGQDNSGEQIQLTINLPPHLNIGQNERDNSSENSANETTGKSFFRFENPIVRWSLIVLLVLAIGSFLLEKRVNKKYTNMPIDEDELEKAVESVIPTKKVIVKKKKAAAKKKPPTIKKKPEPVKKIDEVDDLIIIPAGTSQEIKEIDDSAIPLENLIQAAVKPAKKEELTKKKESAVKKAAVKNESKPTENKVAIKKESLPVKKTTKKSEKK